MTTPKWYVYTLSYPPELEDGRVFYVGKGTARRMYQHENEARAGYTFSSACYTIHIVWNAGYQIVKARVYETDDELDACQKELEFFELHDSDVMVCGRPSVPTRYPNPRGPKTKGPRGPRGSNYANRPKSSTSSSGVEDSE